MRDSDEAVCECCLAWPATDEAGKRCDLCAECDPSTYVTGPAPALGQERQDG